MQERLEWRSVGAARAGGATRTTESTELSGVVAGEGGGHEVVVRGAAQIHGL